jgi:hypothetical protein
VHFVAYAFRSSKYVGAVRYRFILSIV